MNKLFIKNAPLDQSKLPHVIGLAIFGSYHEEKIFNPTRSDIDIAILLDTELDFNDEFNIEDYLDSVLKSYFNFENLHYTFISDFNYPFSELFLISNDKLIFKIDNYLDYALGYSTFKRDREYLEIMRNENLKLLKETL